MLTKGDILLHMYEIQYFDRLMVTFVEIEHSNFQIELSDFIQNRDPREVQNINAVILIILNPHN